MCLVSEITQKKDKLQPENILHILQIKQVWNELYEGTQSESYNILLPYSQFQNIDFLTT
jgi:hypothetical protein